MKKIALAVLIAFVAVAFVAMGPTNSFAQQKQKIEKFGEDNAGVTIERQNALRRLALDALDHTAAEAGMQVEETCGTRRRETLVERSARFFRAQGVFLGQQEGAQMRKGLGATFVMPAEARVKLQETLERIINEGCSGLVCLIL